MLSPHNGEGIVGAHGCVPEVREARTGLKTCPYALPPKARLASGGPSRERDFEGVADGMDSCFRGNDREDGKDKE